MTQTACQAGTKQWLVSHNDNPVTHVMICLSGRQSLQRLSKVRAQAWAMRQSIVHCLPLCHRAWLILPVAFEMNSNTANLEIIDFYDSDAIVEFMMGWKQAADLSLRDLKDIQSVHQNCCLHCLTCFPDLRSIKICSPIPAGYQTDWRPGILEGIHPSPYIQSTAEYKAFNP